VAILPDETEERGGVWVPPRVDLRLVEPLSSIDSGFCRTPGFYVRVSVLLLVALVAFSVLAVRLWSIQIVGQARFERAARQQAFRVVETPGPRGAIVDRAGRPLAGTQPQLQLKASARVLGRLGAGGVWRPSRRGRAVLERLADAAGKETATLVARIRTSLAAEPYADPVVLPRLSRPLAFFVQERQDRFPGLHVESVPIRSYPQGALGGEFLGLVGEIGPSQLRQPRYRDYRAGDPVGRSGVEATHERLLRGGVDRVRIPVDSLGRPVGPAQRSERAHAPRGLRLTIDARLQRAAERAVREGIRLAHAAGHADASAGAALVLDARTGAVEALTSYPSFSQTAAAHDPTYLARLLAPTDSRRPLLDRATQGLYPPGSTFKPIVAEAALASGLIAPSSVLPCTGSLQVGDTVFRNVEPGINAYLTLPQAIAISCDTWFYRLGVAFYERQAASGSLALQTWATRFGLGSPTGIDLPGEEAGLVPTPAWLRRTQSGWHRTWYEGDSVNLSIGQGLLLVTPLQLAVAYAALANGGTIVRPHVADAVLSPSGQVLRRLRFPPQARLHLAGLGAIRDGLFAAAHAPGGTSASVFGDFPVPVVGKTGTAQAAGGSDHSWYASWAPARKPRYVVVVLIEHGGFGAQAAAPAAREIYRAIFRVNGKN
jgi:penicillin-binding protein 2